MLAVDEEEKISSVGGHLCVGGSSDSWIAGSCSVPENIVFGHSVSENTVFGHSISENIGFGHSENIVFEQSPHAYNFPI